MHNLQGWVSLRLFGLVRWPLPPVLITSLSRLNSLGNCMSDSDAPDSSTVAPPWSYSSAPTAFDAWRERLELLISRPSDPGRWAIVVVAVVAALVVGVLLVRKQTPPPELSLPMAGSATEAAVTSSTTTVVAELVVHAAGAVNQPGVYRLTATARVVDLIERAGGPIKEAELDALNLAAPLTDGQRVYVPREGEVVSGPLDVGGSSGEAGLVLDLNTATAEQLDTLPGVGPATARSILDERTQKGRFGSVEDLLDVRGIGEAKLAEIRPLVRV